jgi:hypothetical protein
MVTAARVAAGSSAVAVAVARAVAAVAAAVGRGDGAGVHGGSKSAGGDDNGHVAVTGWTSFKFCPGWALTAPKRARRASKRRGRQATEPIALVLDQKSEVYLGACRGRLPKRPAVDQACGTCSGRIGLNDGTRFSSQYVIWRREFEVAPAAWPLQRARAQPSRRPSLPRSRLR